MTTPTPDILIIAPDHAHRAVCGALTRILSARGEYKTTRIELPQKIKVVDGTPPPFTHVIVDLRQEWAQPLITNVQAIMCMHNVRILFIFPPTPATDHPGFANVRSFVSDHGAFTITLDYGELPDQRLLRQKMAQMLEQPVV